MAKSPFTFDANRQQFRIREGQPNAGRFVKSSTVKAAVDADIAARGERLQELGGRLKRFGADYEAGRITQGDYRAEVALLRRKGAQIIKDSELAYAAAGRGGVEQMDAASYGRAGARIKAQYGYWEQFMQDVLDDPAILRGEADGRMGFEQRLGMYIETARHSYEDERLLANTAAGMTWKQNVPHSSESCHTKDGVMGCSEITAMGKIPIDADVPPVGKRVCLVDHCETIFGRGAI